MDGKVVDSKSIIPPFKQLINLHSSPRSSQYFAVPPTPTWTALTMSGDPNYEKVNPETLGIGTDDVAFQKVLEAQVRLDKERSDKLTTPSLATKTTHTCTSVPPPPLPNHRNNSHLLSPPFSPSYRFAHCRAQTEHHLPRRPPQSFPYFRSPVFLSPHLPNTSSCTKSTPPPSGCPSLSCSKGQTGTLPK